MFVLMRMVVLIIFSLLLLDVTSTKETITVSTITDHPIQTLEQPNTPKNQPSSHGYGYIRRDVSSQTTTTSTFSYVGSTQTYNVPSAGCSSLQITACGAAGNTHLPMPMPMPFH